MSDVMSLPDVTTAVSKCLATMNITRAVPTVSLSISRLRMLCRKSPVPMCAATAAEQHRRSTGAVASSVLPRCPVRTHGALCVPWQATPQHGDARTRRYIPPRQTAGGRGMTRTA